MPLHVTDYGDAFTDLARQYRVPDYVGHTTTILFLLESPHRQELRFGAPVCGPSGLSMSHHLLGRREGTAPLGQLVLQSANAFDDIPRKRHRSQSQDAIAKVGLMNVCEIPMQASAYPEAVARRYAVFLTVLEKLRTTRKKAPYTDPAWQTVHSQLVTRLQERLLLLYDKSLVIVPCGHVAQAYLSHTAIACPNWTVIEGVPHPSFNNWSKAAYQDVISLLASSFREAVLDQ
ncbi:MAG: hypothetical protein OWT28_05800 [Firmicutes bacterium]|nr:hypothetical protein [Bacillota bacterium]